MSYLDPHTDHRTTGEALRKAHADGLVSACVFHLPIPLVDEKLGSPVFLGVDAVQAKRAALRAYEHWDPDRGRFAIGSHSVSTLIRRQRRRPTERIHGPDYQE